MPGQGVVRPGKGTSVPAYASQGARPGAPPGPRNATTNTRRTRLTNVHDVQKVSQALTRTLIDVRDNGLNADNDGWLDIVGLFKECQRNGIDIMKHYSNTELFHGKNISTELKWSYFKVGKIIDIPHPVPNLDPRIKSTDANAVMSKLGPLVAKRRPAVVVAAYQDRCKVLPLYTHGGNGLQYKSPYVQNLGLHVVPQGAQSKAPTSHTLNCDQLPYGQTDGESIVYPTDSYTVDYRWPIGSFYQGQLDERSVERLLKIYDLYQEAGNLPLEKQASFVEWGRRAINV